MSSRRFVVLGGAGAIGRTIVRDLLESHPRNHIVVADRIPDSEHRSRRVTSRLADAKDRSSLSGVLRGNDVVINCTSHHLNLHVMNAALSAGVHYLDLGGLFDFTRKQLRLKRKFGEAGLVAVLGMGCAPGITNVLAAKLGRDLERVHKIRIRVGSRNDGSFSFPYSAQTIVEELTTPAWKYSRGKFVLAPPRSGWERVTFDNPVGDVWTVLTRHSEIATLPAHFRKKGLAYADFKVSFDRAFVRELMRRLRAGWTVKDFAALPASRKEVSDYEITRVVVSGSSTRTADCHARANPKWNATAGDTDTACPASIVAQMIVDGRITTPGVWAPEDIVPIDEFLTECESRGMRFFFDCGGGL